MRRGRTAAEEAENRCHWVLLEWRCIARRNFGSQIPRRRLYRPPEKWSSTGDKILRRNEIYRETRDMKPLPRASRKECRPRGRDQLTWMHRFRRHFSTLHVAGTHFQYVVCSFTPIRAAIPFQNKIIQRGRVATVHPEGSNITRFRTAKLLHEMVTEWRSIPKYDISPF